MTAPRTSWPYWVRIVLWKTNRPVARKCVWLSLLAALISAAVAVCCMITAWTLRLAGAAGVFAVLFFLVAIVYHRAIGWVDRHGTWN